VSRRTLFYLITNWTLIMEEANLLQVKELVKDAFNSFKRELKEETKTPSTKLFKKFHADSNDNIDLKHRGNRKQHEFNVQVANIIEEAAEYLKRPEQATDFDKQQQLLDEVKRYNTEGTIEVASEAAERHPLILIPRPTNGSKVQEGKWVQVYAKATRHVIQMRTNGALEIHVFQIFWQRVR
ncbi:unnamed protein product, partial [Owenia fusiformis]